MKKFLITSLAFASFSSFVALPAFAAPEEFTLDPTHTSVTWQVSHIGFSTFYGKFNKVTGTLTLDEAKPEASKVSVKFDMSGIISGVEKLDEHLKTDAFFDVAKYPTATFESTKVEVTSPGKTARVTGNLTLHGVTKPVVLDVTLNKIGEYPMTKKKAVGFDATATIKRSDFGVSYGIPMVPDDVKIMIESEGSLS